MKIVATIFMMFFLQKIYAQKVLYTFNTDKYFSEAEIKTAYESISKSLPPSLILKPNIYHSEIKKDTIINFISFNTNKKATGEEAIFKFSHNLDSTFLLLNQKLPPFRLKSLDGKEVNNEQLLGKPTLINFWAIYCSPCIEEMPQLSQLKEKYKDQMNFISITENNGNEDNLISFLKDKHFNFPVLEDGQVYKDRLKLQALPRNLFIDKSGVLRFIQVNYPVNERSVPLEVNDKTNYFTKLIEQLIQEGK